MHKLDETIKKSCADLNASILEAVTKGNYQKYVAFKKDMFSRH